MRAVTHVLIYVELHVESKSIAYGSINGPTYKSVEVMFDLKHFTLSGQIALIRETRSLCSKSLLSSPFYLTTNQRSIASENHIESALTSELDDLTEIY